HDVYSLRAPARCDAVWLAAVASLVRPPGVSLLFESYLSAKSRLSRRCSVAESPRLGLRPRGRQAGVPVLLELPPQRFVLFLQGLEAGAHVDDHLRPGEVDPELVDQALHLAHPLEVGPGVEPDPPPRA